MAQPLKAQRTLFIWFISFTALTLLGLARKMMMESGLIIMIPLVFGSISLFAINIAVGIYAAVKGRQGAGTWVIWTLLVAAAAALSIPTFNWRGY